VAGKMCIYTNDKVTLEELGGEAPEAKKAG
jgi:ATP-dependent protease HslVU (ClpYQ) peptidase subunit